MMKRMLFFRGILLSVIILVSCLIVVPGAFSDTMGARGKAKQTLFKQANLAFKGAKEKKADLFSPQAFNEGKEYYEDAEKAFAKGKDLEDIEEDLERAVEYFNTAMENCTHASIFFESTKKSRDDAENVNALKYEYQTWKNADNYFKKAIIRYENGDLDKAKSDAKQAEKLYRTAELETIKTSYLDSVRKDIAKLKEIGKKNNAPIIFAKAEKLANQASAELDKQRYSNENARRLVDEAEYEIKHALFVHNLIRKMKEADYTFEHVIIDGERALTRVCDELDITPKFDKGLGEVDRTIVAEIKKIKLQNARQAKKLAARESEISELNTRITKMMNDEEELKRQRKMAEEALKKQKLAEARHRKKIHTIRSAFGHTEGKVLMDGKNIIIRLYGLNFPSGKAVIEPQYFGLLTKVRKSFSMFKNCEVVIEGHTDSVGSDAVNQKLSEQRAEAVKQYILANASIPESRITAIGYGETKPVASNETPQGQAKNRRIDVVIIPSDK